MTFFFLWKEWRNKLTASFKTSLFIGKMCSIRTKGKREERTSLSSSMSRSLLFTPLLLTLCAVPLSRFGSIKQKRKSLQWNPSFHRHSLFLSKKLYVCVGMYVPWHWVWSPKYDFWNLVPSSIMSSKDQTYVIRLGQQMPLPTQSSCWSYGQFYFPLYYIKILVPYFVCKNICFKKGYM